MFSAFRFVFEFPNYLLNQFVEVNLRFGHFIATHAREREQVVDKRAHLSG